MRTTGLRGRSSPMNRATPEQVAAIEQERIASQREGVQRFAVHHSPYCGPGSAGDKGAITVDNDGRIRCWVYPDGFVRH